MAKHARGLARTDGGQRSPSLRGQGFAAFALMLAVSLALTGCATTTIPDIEPVNLESGANTIRLEVVGRYSGGIFALTETSTPHYDPVTKRLYVPRTDIGRILVLDISDPSRPERIYDPGATVAQDLEPEGLAVSFDSQTAWIGLQRNNAMAVLDIPRAKVVGILPLGTKDHSQPGNGIDASDLEPEEVFFIPASDAPTGDPLIALVHEVSDSVTLYRIEQVR